MSLAGETPGDATTARGWRAALVDRLKERYDAAKDPAGRVTLAWLIRPADLPAAPEGAGARHDPSPEARKAADADYARWVAANRLRSLADGLNALKPRPAAAAATLAGHLNDAADRLDGWSP